MPPITTSAPTRKERSKHHYRRYIRHLEKLPPRVTGTLKPIAAQVHHGRHPGDLVVGR
jgi:hypothetical protein